ncbi:unnamed protein product, partial [Onchocerca ochengi]|uniref:Helitron_like_N domain-containing protein n=1 Tax=Onchocerca ochengi TaxID=42157 RepID=A0A182EW15_ONCOC
MPSDTHKTVIHADKTPAEEHVRRFNASITDEAAVVRIIECLIFIRLNQTKLRSKECIHLQDAVVNDGDTTKVGRRTISPSSYAGSPSLMHEYVQDAIAQETMNILYEEENQQKMTVNEQSYKCGMVTSKWIT